MRQRLSAIGLFLLVAVLILAGVTGCEKKAAERVSEATETAALVSSSPTPGGVETTAVPGETVVSAVTSMPGTEPAPGPTPGAGTPAAAQPTAVVIPTSPSGSSESQPTPSTPGGEALVHTVQQGETLTSIAQRYGATTQSIAQANGLVNPNQIYVGQKLKIPTAGSPTGGTSGCRIRHTVQSGEWVWQIARDYGVSPYDILAANGLTIQTANTIYPGKVLCIP
jgi:LysM repeat protein